MGQQEALGVESSLEIGWLPPPVWQCEAARSQTWQTEAASAVSLAEPLSCPFPNCSRACTWQQFSPRQAHSTLWCHYPDCQSPEPCTCVDMKNIKSRRLPRLQPVFTYYQVTAPFYANRTAPWVNSRVDLVHSLHVSVHKIPRLRTDLSFMSNGVSVTIQCLPTQELHFLDGIGMFHQPKTTKRGTFPLAFSLRDLLPNKTGLFLYTVMRRGLRVLLSVSLVYKRLMWETAKSRLRLTIWRLVLREVMRGSVLRWYH